MELTSVARRLAREVDDLRFAAPLTHVYNPLLYAWRPQREYLRRFGTARRDLLLVGMNPGPWGMVQTGVPFGDVPMVRDWMGIEAPVDPPFRPHPRRPVEGFACGRREVSGQRLWGWAAARFGSPARCFKRLFIWNYCPLAFFEADGRNRTPDKLRAGEREALFDACDRALARVAERLAPRYVLGVGRFAEQRVRAVLGDGSAVLGSVPHPSPASPAANRGWAALMDQALARHDVAID